MRLQSAELKQKIQNAMANKGHYFTVICKKRHEDTLRIFNAKWLVKKHLKGGQEAYNADDKNLMRVVVHNSGGWRSINCDDIALVVVRTKESNYREIIVNDVRSYPHCANYQEAQEVLSNALEDHRNTGFQLSYS